MPFNNYKGYSLRNRVFFGFLTISLLSVAASAILSFIILRDNAKVQSITDKQSRSQALMSSLDYALSHTEVNSTDLPFILGNKIYEIADVNKNDVIIYDLKGNYLLSNKDPNLVVQKSIPNSILKGLQQDSSQQDFTSYDEGKKASLTSSYMVLKNNMLEDIGYVYFPYYHNESSYLDVFNQYLSYVIAVNIFIILFSIWLSWIISNNLTQAITKFSNIINNLTLFDEGLKPIKYYKNDELNALVRSYNKLISEIADQRERLKYQEKEQAWREMAKQVAHEVKNPLTPMKLLIQNFDRKFDPQDPNINQKVKSLTKVMVDQIDLISQVAGAFSEFAQLPPRNDETFDIVDEIKNTVNVFATNNIFVHTNKEVVMVKMDKIFLSRIVNNLLTNAIQAQDSTRESLINVDIENVNKRITIVIHDNGVGIPAEKINKIFEPNFTTKTSGMGLGLTMVRKMIEDYQGNITVKSEVGKSTDFTIYLPTNL